MTHRLQIADHLWFDFSRKLGFVTMTFVLTLMPLECVAVKNSTYYVQNVAYNDACLADEQIAVFETRTELTCLMSCYNNEECQSISYNSLSMECQLFLVEFWDRPVTRTNESGWLHYDPFRALDCKDVQRKQHQYSTGIYTIFPHNFPSFSVNCEMGVDGGGWMLIQQRYDGTVSFQRPWAEYKAGFGNLSGEFWLGNDRIHAITASAAYELRVDIGDWEGNSWYAVYKTFRVDDENSKYKLTVGGYSGTAGDTLVAHNDMFFTTMDEDNDPLETGNCSIIFGGGGGWWFSNCDAGNLNGNHTQAIGGVNWVTAKNDWSSMKVTRMMVRRL